MPLAEVLDVVHHALGVHQHEVVLGGRLRLHQVVEKALLLQPPHEGYQPLRALGVARGQQMVEVPVVEDYCHGGGMAGSGHKDFAIPGPHTDIR